MFPHRTARELAGEEVIVNFLAVCILGAILLVLFGWVVGWMTIFIGLVFKIEHIVMHLFTKS